MSRSRIPTLAPVSDMAAAIFTATVDLPTPPLLLAIAMVNLTRSPMEIAMDTMASPAGAQTATTSIRLFTLEQQSFVMA